MADNGPILVAEAAASASGGKAIAVQANAAKQSDIERLFAETEKAFGRLDILVNNAGICEGNLVFLASPQSGWTTGESLFVVGGMR